MEKFQGVNTFAGHHSFVGKQACYVASDTSSIRNSERSEQGQRYPLRITILTAFSQSIGVEE